MKNKTKKITLTTILIIVIISIIIGVSYAYWSSRADQKAMNKVKSDCLKIELTNESNEINLESAYPIRDEEAESLTPYTFTIKNACSSSVYYKVDLEIMDETDRLASKYIAVDINDTGKKLLSSYTSVEPTYKDKEYTAVESRELIEYGILEGGATATYNLKLWMDESVTIDDDAMNKYFTSKISVIASQETFNPVLARYITDLAKSDTTNLVYDDGTIDHNTRYIGSAPSNYLCFDAYCSNGKWRVIGVMNNIETEKSGTQSLVKIIRADSIGIYSWDTNSVNDWTTSTLQVNLNSGDLYAKYIKDYDDLLETVTWNLGGTNTNALDASSFYNVERGTATYGTRPTTWSGKIGLMYPSDYGLATSGGDTTDRATCLATNLVSWNSTDPDVSDCKNNDYLYLKTTEWALTPSSGESNRVFIVYSTGYVNYYSYYGISSYLYAVRPVGYLKASTEILSGNGTSSSPWIIGE